MKAKRLSKTEHLMTLKDWGELPDETPGELVEGHLEGEELTTPAHDAITGYLFALFFAWVRPRGGMVFVPDRKYAVSSRRGRKPDVSVFLHVRGLVADAKVTSVAPDIAIEVVTPTPRDIRRDRVEKRREYARFGVRWYWIVDPSLRTVEILELTPKGHYADVADGTLGKLRVPGCRGLTLDLDELWREADRLKK